MAKSTITPKSANRQKYNEDTIRTAHSIQRLCASDDGQQLMMALDQIFGARHTSHDITSEAALMRVGEMNVLVWIRAMIEIASTGEAGGGNA
jgi:hypothetical protein